MKLTSGILLLAMTAGGAYAQSPNILQSTKDKLNAAQQQRVAQENAALSGGQATSAKPAPAGKPAVKTVAQTSAPATKPAVQPAKAAVQQPKPAAPAAKPATQANVKPGAPATAKPAQAKAEPQAHKQPSTKISIAPVAPQPKQGAQKTKAVVKKEVKKDAAPNKAEAKNEAKPASTDSAIAEAPKEKKTITAEGRRDPFISPVVSRASGPNCSVGKRCLAIDQISVRGVVKSDAGMIAVVVNSLNKAYFLKENDPVYNGYVVKITGDSVVFKETVQDRLGKESTREVVKKITTPAV
jgi:Tfp pilus assembly protein PilP